MRKQSLVAFLLFSVTAASPSESSSLNSPKILPNTEPLCNAATVEDAPGTKTTAEQSCILHDGLTRCFYIYIPTSLQAATTATNTSHAANVPVVFDLHGYNLCAVKSISYTGWARVAEETGAFIVVFPQGNMNAEVTNEPCWSFGDCCCSLGDISSNATGPFVRPPPAEVDDIGFLRQIVANLVNDTTLQNEGLKVDTQRLYFAGHSNGCMMAHSMAALQSDLVAAVCCHASSLMVPPSPDYTPTAVQVAYGDLDTSLDFFFGSKTHILETWGDINNCTSNVTTVVDESQLYATHTRSNCSNNVKVQTIEEFNVGHFNYLGVPPNTSLSVGSYPGAQTPQVDSTWLSWEFCKEYALAGPPVLPEAVRWAPAPVFANDTDEDAAMTATTRTAAMASKASTSSCFGGFAIIMISVGCVVFSLLLGE